MTKHEQRAQEYADKVGYCSVTSHSRLIAETLLKHIPLATLLEKAERLEQVEAENARLMEKGGAFLNRYLMWLNQDDLHDTNITTFEVAAHAEVFKEELKPKDSK